VAHSPGLVRDTVEVGTVKIVLLKNAKLFKVVGKVAGLALERSAGPRLDP
jgi:hypothetical protein